jgi:hypothetical protein
MSDAHKVKEFLLEWLLNHGREPVYRHIAWDLRMVSGYYLKSVMSMDT